MVHTSIEDYISVNSIKSSQGLTIHSLRDCADKPVVRIAPLLTHAIRAVVKIFCRLYTKANNRLTQTEDLNARESGVAIGSSLLDMNQGGAKLQLKPM
jgi:hypothetical protein